MRYALGLLRSALGCLVVAVAAEGVRAVPPAFPHRDLAHQALTVNPTEFESARSSRGAATAGAFPSSGISLLSQVPVSQLRGSFGATSTNDIWGYVSPSGREYAIVGLNVGTAFVEVTDPVNPVVVDTLIDANSIWSDIRTFGKFAYNVNESGGGMQVIALGNIDAGVVSPLTPLTASGLQTAHNVSVNEDSGFAYLCGSNLGNGLVAVDLADPRHPALAGLWSGPYVHDAQIVTYTTGVYAGREIAFCFCGSVGVYIVDVTDKANMFTLGTLAYPNVTFSHQGWLSEDRRTLFADDELDELQNPNVSTTTTYVLDVQDLSNPLFVTTYTNGANSIDHNLFVRGNYIYLGNYTSGLRVYDASDVNNLQEIGFFDTTPGNNSLGFGGVWGNYPFLPSGIVIVSDESNGLFVLDVSAIVPPPCGAPAMPLAESDPIEKNRYVSLRPGNPGHQVALRVSLTNLPPGHDALQGTDMWVDAPVTVSSSGGPLSVARLRCDPLYRNWGDVDVLHLFGSEFLPNATYSVQAVEQVDCGQGVQLFSSTARTLRTSLIWGDVSGGAPSGPDGMANFADITSIVEAFQGSGIAPDVTVADLAPGLPDQVVNFVDINAGVDAFKGAAFPFAGPSACP